MGLQAPKGCWRYPQTLGSPASPFGLTLWIFCPQFFQYSKREMNYGTEEPQLMMVPLWENLNFDLFLDQQYCSTTLSWCWAAAAPLRPPDHEGKQPVSLKLFCPHAFIPFSTFSTVFNKLHELFNTLS